MCLSLVSCGDNNKPEPIDNTSTLLVGTWTYEATSKMVSLVDEDGYLLEGEIVSINATDIKLKLISDGGDRPEDYGFEVFYYLKK